MINDIEKKDFVQLSVGDVVTATVKRIKPDCAIMSLGDIIAVLPSSEFSWLKKKNLKKELQIGNTVNAVVIQIQDKGVILSIKRLSVNPWCLVGQTYKTGQKIKGIISAIQSYGVFIEIETGVTGLLHRKEMSTNEQKCKIKKFFTKGQQIEVEIISIDVDNRRMSFSQKDFH